MSDPSPRKRVRMLVATLAVTCAACGEARSGSAPNGDSGAGSSGTMSEPPSPSGSASPELAPCNPLLDWERDLGLDNPVVVTQLSTGEFLVVTRLASGFVVWLGEGNALVPHGVTYATEGGPDVSLVVDAGPGPDGVAGSFVVSLSPATDPTKAWLGGEAAAQRVRETPAPLSSSLAPLAIQPLSTLQELYPERFHSPARVESRLVAADGSELVLVGPAFERDVRQLRVFYGAPDRLIEQQIADLAQVYAGYRPELEFSLRTAEGIAHVTLPGLYAWDDEQRIQGDGLARIGVETSVLQDRPRTALSVAGLQFECAPAANAWALSNARAVAAPAALCPRGSALRHALRAGDDAFRCVALTSGLSYAPDDLTVEAEFTAVVAEIGTGQPPVGCDAAATVAPNDGLSLLWVRLERGDQSALITLRAPETTLPFAVGDELEVSYGLYVPRSEALTLRRTSGELLVWWAQASELSQLDTPVELSLAQGPEQCATTLGCYDTSQYALRATFGNETVTVPYGDRVEQGGFLLIHEGLDVSTAADGYCIDDDHSPRAGAELWAVPPVAE